MTKNKKDQQGFKSPWSHPVDSDQAGIEFDRLEIAPDAAQSKALADHFGVKSISGVKADLRFIRVQAGLVIHIKGRFQADILQECVVTLEPIETHLDESFDGWYADPDQALSFQKAKQQREMQKQHGEAPILEEEDDPEAIVDGQIDLGDLVTQFISLAIDPYPVKEGAEIGAGDVPKVQDKEPVRKNPFEKLKEWKEKQ